MTEQTTITCQGYHVTEPMYKAAPETYPKMPLEEAPAQGWRQVADLCFAPLDYGPVWLCSECVARYKAYLVKEMDERLDDLTRSHKATMAQLRASSAARVNDAYTSFMVDRGEIKVFYNGRLAGLE